MILGMMIVGIGLVGLVYPSGLIRLVQVAWRTPWGMFLAVAFRLLMGVVLLLAAPESRFPLTLKILGAITVAAAVALPFVGYARISRMITWWNERRPGVIRGWAVVAIAFGGFLIYAALGD